MKPAAPVNHRIPSLVEDAGMGGGAARGLKTVDLGSCPGVTRTIASRP